jgi:8-oxo-dGTP pyrophosphatase MutT (NUDIX family)
MMKKLNEWKILSREKKYQGIIFSCYDVLLKTGKGESTIFNVLKTLDWINIVATTNDNQILMVRQYRVGAESFTLETPGGAVNPGEDLELAARRELREETGYDCETIEKLMSVEVNPAFMNNRCHFYWAKNCRHVGELIPDQFEEIEVIKIPISDIQNQLKSGKITHSLVVSALLLFNERRVQF